MLCSWTSCRQALPASKRGRRVHARPGTSNFDDLSSQGDDSDLQTRRQPFGAGLGLRKRSSFCQVDQLRDAMCQVVRVSSFQHGLDFESSAFPLILRDVSCQKCCAASHVDVTSHPTRGPGLWVCGRCNSNYDKAHGSFSLLFTARTICKRGLWSCCITSSRRISMKSIKID